MKASSTEARPIATWMQVLDQIEAAVGRRLAQVEEPPPDLEAAPTTKTPLQTLDERLAQMRARLDQAERDAAEVDAALNTEAEAYQRWTESMTAARRRLADWTAGVA
jgi:chromosome segregation ATPase